VLPGDTPAGAWAPRGVARERAGGVGSRRARSCIGRTPAAPETVGMLGAPPAAGLRVPDTLQAGRAGGRRADERQRGAARSPALAAAKQDTTAPAAAAPTRSEPCAGSAETAAARVPAPDRALGWLDHDRRRERSAMRRSRRLVVRRDLGRWPPRCSNPPRAPPDS
jgi:hypothetical protein